MNSQTRLRLAASHDLAPGLKAGANWESGYTVNPSSRVSIDDENVPATVNKRHADVYLAGEWGRIALGRGSSAEDNPAKPRRTFAYGKLGYLHGKHAISLDYAQGRDYMLDGDRSSMVGVGYVHTAATWLELYAGIKSHGLERVGRDFHAITLITAGTRLKF